MAKIKIDLKKPSIPIDFGEVEIHFYMDDAAIDRLMNFNVTEEIEKIQIKFSKYKEEGTLKEKESQMVDEMRDALTLVYDDFFGEGTFQKIYEVYPSVLVLIEGLQAVMEELPEEISLYMAKKADKQTKAINKYRSMK